MKNVGDLMKRLQKMMPANVKPAFTTGEELLAWQKEQGEIRAAALARENRAMKMQRTFNRSGIRPLHQNCSFDNYKVETTGQMNALAAARQYVNEFDGNIASFIFSGKPGTGKNHLAAAICNELLLRGKSVLIITVADIMSAMKDTFSNRETSEEQLLNDLSNVDLLVIDEIGVQTESRYEKVIINQIVDRRSSSKRPTGMLTNHNIDEMTRPARGTGDGPHEARQQPVCHLRLGKLPQPRHRQRVLGYFQEMRGTQGYILGPLLHQTDLMSRPL
ncbi:DNA replication protein DnaC [Enterobacter cancerogenus]|uniref:Replicative helicase loader DnaC n=1 Tax=Enterobacter cancerogenus TaxID=69218 RepID=A0A484ZA01_9ENTR|nr:DNA replication protein DnaC [Enterobacter cancerogenus]